jgi:hypothetical protein
MNRRNKTQKNQKNLKTLKTLKRSLKRKYSGGAPITPIKVTEIIDLILDIYNHAEYREHLIQFMDDLQTQYNRKYNVKDIKKNDVIIQKGIVSSQQNSLSKSSNDITTYVNTYFNEIDTNNNKKYSHRENIQSLINGRYYYKPMIADLVYVLLNNIKRFIKSNDDNRKLMISIFKTFCDIVKEILEQNLLTNISLFNEFFEKVKEIISKEFQEKQHTHIIETFLRILYTLIDNIINDQKTKNVYISLIRDKINEKDHDSSNNELPSIVKNLEIWKNTIICYLSHTEYLVSLLEKDEFIILITHLISNKQEFSDINTGIHLLFGELGNCNAGALSTGILNSFNIFYSYMFLYKKPIQTLNNIPELPEINRQQSEAILKNKIEKYKEKPIEPLKKYDRSIFQKAAHKTAKRTQEALDKVSTVFSVFNKSK